MPLGPLGFVSERDVELIVPLAGIFFIFGLPVIAWLMMRGMKHRERQMAHLERIEMIRKGLDPGAVPPEADASFSVGAHGAYRGPRGYDASPTAQVALQKGLVLAAIGLAITLGLSFIGYGPWLIGGFVPLFIGLAQILIAVNSGAQLRFGPSMSPPPQAPPAPPTGQSQPYPSATYEGSYTYRPGATQELRPPTPPPAER